MGGLGGPSARLAVLLRLLGDGGLAQVVANRVKLDLHRDEGLAIVDAHHLWQEDPVSQVCPHHLSLPRGRRHLLGLAEVKRLVHLNTSTVSPAPRRPRVSRRCTAA